MDQADKPIARVYDHYLYSSALRKLIPRHYSREDSIAFVQTYLYKWARRQLLLEQAMRNLSEEAVAGLEKRVADYRNDLLIETYEQYVTSAKVDSAVSDSQVTAYYDRYPQAFSLDETIVQLRYIVLPKGSDEVRRAEALLRHTDSLSRSALAALAFRNATAYRLDDRAWISWRRIRAEFPSSPRLATRLLGAGKNFKLEDTLSVYLGRIRAVEFRGARAPVTYIKPVIKRLIRNHRRLSYLENMENDLLNYATRNKNFERYD